MVDVFDPDGKVFTFVCDRCGQEYIAHEPSLNSEDVFHLIQAEMGRTVCPECLDSVQEKPCP